MNPAMAAQYRQQQQQQYQQRPPQPQARRAPGPPAMTHEQARIARERQQRENEKEKRQEQDRERAKAARPTDKNMPDGVDKLIVGEGVDQYKRLRELERKLDSVMMRKYLDTTDPVWPQTAFTSYQTKRRKLKIWISNTVENQPWQGGGMEESAFDFSMGVEATYRVRIEGQVIDEEDEDDQDTTDDEAEENAQQEDKMEINGEPKTNGDEQGEDKPKQGTQGEDKQNKNKPSEDSQENEKSKASPPASESRHGEPQEKTKLSHFFKSITIDFDRNRNLQSEGMSQIEWKKQISNAGVLNPSADFDSLEFERKSDENINCTINFYWDEPPDRQRYLLDKPLSELLDTEVDDRPSIIMGIWEYVKAMGLQQDENKRQIHCDDRMKAVFEKDTIYFPHIPPMLQHHLFPLPPVSVPYTIHVDSEYHSLPSAQRYTIYELTCPPITSPAPAPATDVDTLKRLAKRDAHLAEIIQAIGNSQRKHSFFSQMGRDPVTFTKRWMASQKRDLEIIMGEDGKFEDSSYLAGEWARGGRTGVWGGNEVKEAVNVMVQKPDKTGRAF